MRKKGGHAAGTGSTMAMRRMVVRPASQMWIFYGGDPVNLEHCRED